MVRIYRSSVNGGSAGINRVYAKAAVPYWRSANMAQQLHALWERIDEAEKRHAG